MFIPGPGVLPKLIRTEFRRFAPNGFHAASKKKKKKEKRPQIAPRALGSSTFRAASFLLRKRGVLLSLPPAYPGITDA